MFFCYICHSFYPDANIYIKMLYIYFAKLLFGGGRKEEETICKREAY